MKMENNIDFPSNAKYHAPMNDKEILKIVNEKIDQFTGDNCQLLLDSILAAYPTETWESIPGYSDAKADIFYDGDKWKTARWLVHSLQNGNCAKCGESLNVSFELHHARRGADYFALQIDKLEALHKWCHGSEHRMVLKDVFLQRMQNKDKKDNTMTHFEKIEEFFSKNKVALNELVTQGRNRSTFALNDFYKKLNLAGPDYFSYWSLQKYVSRNRLIPKKYNKKAGVTIVKSVTPLQNLSLTDKEAKVVLLLRKKEQLETVKSELAKLLS